MTVKIIVHGGAGRWQLNQKRLNQAIVACQQAAKVGQSVLLSGGRALTAVEEAVRVLEDDPSVDAGRGSYPNKQGKIELDALIMDGKTLNLGAVAAVQHIRNPITLARTILEECEHNFLVGSGAEIFAESVGIPRCELDDLLFLWSDSLAENSLGEYQSSTQNLDGPAADTVGAVAIDSFGNLAAATSTGGIRNKLPGRVGDSPLVGSGAYADNETAAVSATGEGESLMKIVISKQVCDYVAAGKSAQEACEAAIQILNDRVSGQGGLIAIDKEAQIGISFNTDSMPFAYAEDDSQIISGFEPSRTN